MKRSSRYWIILAVVMVSAVYSVAPLLLPVPQPETAPLQEFSAARALRHVSVISKEAHPAGSDAMKEVANYLVQTLQEDGLQAEIQETTGHSQWMDQTFALNNVVARIEGTNPTGAMLIMAHADSTPFGPGAGDNATGAATLLEIVRALKAGAPPKNDIIFLFDDGEEYMYLGGYAFTREHPWMTDVRLVIGIDTAAWGPSTLLQTIPPSRALIQGYAKAVKQPVAFGSYADYDWTIGHDTSLIFPFVEQGIPGLDFEDPTASTAKHSAADTIEKVKPGSMQQMGDQVLAIARAYGDMDLNELASPEQSFFTLWGFKLVHYPAAINLILTVFLLLGFGGLSVLGVQQKVYNSKRLIVASLSMLGMVLLSGVLGLVAGELFARLFPKPNDYIDKYLVPSSLPYLILSLALITGVYITLRVRLERKVGKENLAPAGLLPWIGLSLVFVAIAPVGSYAFVLPALFGLITWGIVTFTRLGDNSIARLILLALPMIAGILLLLPNLALMFISTGVDIWLTAMVTVMLVEMGLAAAG